MLGHVVIQSTLVVVESLKVAIQNDGNEQVEENQVDEENVAEEVDVGHQGIATTRGFTTIADEVVVTRVLNTIFLRIT